MINQSRYYFFFVAVFAGIISLIVTITLIHMPVWPAVLLSVALGGVLAYLLTRL